MAKDVYGASHCYSYSSLTIFCWMCFFQLMACDQKSSCERLLKEQDFSAATQSCQQEYLYSSDYLTLTRLITALIKLERYSDVETLLSNISDKKTRADAYYFSGYQLLSINTSLASKFYKKSAEIYRTQKPSTSLVNVLRTLTRLAWQDFDHREALSLASQSLKTSRMLNDIEGELASLRLLFIILEEIGHASASDHVLSIIENKLDNGTPAYHRFDAYINRGLLQIRNNEFGLALHNFRKALNTPIDPSNKDAMRGLHLNLSHVNLQLNRITDAKEHLKMAWRFAKADGSTQYALKYVQAKILYKEKNFEAAKNTLKETLELPDIHPIWKWELYYWLGKIARELDNSEQAVNYFKQSIREIEALREKLSFDQLKAHILADKRKPYEALFSEYFRLEQIDKAIAISEQVKSRSFIDQYIASSAKTDISDLSDISFENISNNVDQLLQYLTLMKPSKSLSMKPLRNVFNALNDRRVISYFFADSELYKISITKNHQLITKLDLSNNDLTELLYKYYGATENDDVLKQLGNLLFPNISALSNQSHLYISPDKLLSKLAFSSLKVNDNFLVENFSISLIPSASALVELDTANSSAGEYKIVMGDPKNDLPASKREAEIVARKLDALLYTGEQAKFKSIPFDRDIDLLHISSHSGVNHLGPWIRFADGDISGIKFIRTKVIPKVAVLASCNSATQSSEYIWSSFGGMLLTAGAHSVVASLWSVEDTATQELIVEFYRNLKQGQSVSVALSKAQRLSIQNGLGPNSWAPFVVLGDSMSQPVIIN